MKEIKKLFYSKGMRIKVIDDDDSSLIGKYGKIIYVDVGGTSLPYKILFDDYLNRDDYEEWVRDVEPIYVYGNSIPASSLTDCSGSLTESRDTTQNLINIMLENDSDDNTDDFLKLLKTTKPVI